MVDPAEQEPKPDRSRRVRNWAVGAAAVSAAAALVAPFVLHDKTVEARPAPSTTTYSPETPAPAPTTEAPTPAPTETAKPAATDIPEQLIEGREKLQVNATNAALSVLRDMERPNVGMTHEGLDARTLGNPSDDKPKDVPEMLAEYKDGNVIHIRSIVGNNGGEGGGTNAKDAASVDLAFQVTDENPIASKTDQLTPADFRTAIQDTEHTTLLYATAQAEGKWMTLSFDEHRVRATDLADDPNNIYVVDRVDEYNELASGLATTMETAQDQLAQAAARY